MPNAKTPAVPALVTVLFTLFVAANGTQALSSDGDVAMHLVLGRKILAERAWLPDLPTTWSVAGVPYIDHEWLTQVLYALSDRALGLQGPVLITAAVIGAAVWLLFTRARAAGARAWPTLIVTLGALVLLMAHLPTRPHTFSLLLVGVFTEWLERLRRGDLALRPFLVRALPTAVLWAQLHGGFLVLLPLVAAFAVGTAIDAFRGDSDRARAMAVAAGGALTVAVTVLNPWGLGLHAHFLAWLNHPLMMNLTSEFRPPQGPYLWLVCAWGVGIGLAVIGRRDRSAVWLLLAGGMLYLATRQARHAIVMAMVTAPWIAASLEDLLGRLAERDDALGMLGREVRASSDRLDELSISGRGLAALAVATLVGALGVMQVARPHFDPSLQPVDTADWLDREGAPQGRLFNHFNNGAYLAYRGHSVFIDSWHDHQGPERLARWVALDGARPGWDAALRDLDVGWVVYPPDAPLAAALDASPDWVQTHADPVATVWVRAPR